AWRGSPTRFHSGGEPRAQFLCGTRSESAVPEGLSDNSPAFQRREPIRRPARPEGTADSGILFRPALRDLVHSASDPAVNCGLLSKVPSEPNTIRFTLPAQKLRRTGKLRFHIPFPLPLLPHPVTYLKLSV